MKTLHMLLWYIGMDEIIRTQNNSELWEEDDDDDDIVPNSSVDVIQNSRLL